MTQDSQITNDEPRITNLERRTTNNYQRTTSKRISYFILIFLIQPVSIYARGTGTTGAEFLKLGLGARPAAMGGAYAGISHDANANYWNPGGLNFVRRSELTTMHLEYILDIRYESLSFVQPLVDLDATYGLTFSLLHQGKLDKTIEDQFGGFGGKVGEFTASDYMLGLSYGQRFNIAGYDVPLGVTLKFLHSKIDVESSQGVAFDIGSLYRWYFRGKELNAGFVVTNIGALSKFKFQSDPLPTGIRAGFSFKPFRDRLTLSWDIESRRGDSARLRVGSEFWIKNFFAVRGGYVYTRDRDIRRGWTAGAGIRYKNFELDYAFIPLRSVFEENTHRISGTIQFGEPRVLLEDKVRRVSVSRTKGGDETLRPKRSPGGYVLSYDAPRSRNVSVVGEFNYWNPEKNKLVKDISGIWRATIQLPRGENVYQFVVDGEWVNDPNNPVTTLHPGQGRISSVTVEKDYWRLAKKSIPEPGTASPEKSVVSSIKEKELIEKEKELKKKEEELKIAEKKKVLARQLAKEKDLRKKRIKKERLKSKILGPQHPELAPKQVGGYVVFSCHAPEAESVYVVGDFNDWDVDMNELIKDDRGVWQARIGIPPGIYHYKYIIDNVIEDDYNNPVKEDDGTGRTVSVVYVNKTKTSSGAGVDKSEELIDSLLNDFDNY